jgi:hypothetical protein
MMDSRKLTDIFSKKYVEMVYDCDLHSNVDDAWDSFLEELGCKVRVDGDCSSLRGEFILIEDPQESRRADLAIPLKLAEKILVLGGLP